MNLYKQTFQHWSPKDSEKGISKYFLASSNREAYDIVYGKYDCVTVDRFCDFNSEEYDTFEIDYVEYLPSDLDKEKVINIVADKRGELNFDDIDSLDCFNDLYYGMTLEGWDLVREDITPQDIEVLKTLGVLE